MQGVSEMETELGKRMRVKGVNVSNTSLVSTDSHH